MSKLWIVHPRPTVRAALVRATGLSASEVAQGAPTLDDFDPASPPRAVLLALAGELEREVAFAHDARQRVPAARWIIVCPAGEAEAVKRIFDAVEPRVLEIPPDRERLRAELVAAFARPASESLLERDRRTRSDARFEAWLGTAELPGLARALDPGLSGLPLLVRGRKGSGRSLLVQHAERARGGSTSVLRCDGRAVGGLDAVLARLRGAGGDGTGPLSTVWIDELVALPSADQRALADWIAHDLAPAPIPPGRFAPRLRWLATAGPTGLTDRLDESLARAFVPLTLQVPPLERTLDSIGRIAAQAASEWAETTRTPLRHFDDASLLALADSPLWGDRAELEAVLRTSLAASEAARLGPSDLRYAEDLVVPHLPTPPRDASASASAGRAPAQSGRDMDERSTSELGELPIDRDADPSSALLDLTGAWAEAPATPTTDVAIDVATDQATDHSIEHAPDHAPGPISPSPAPGPPPSAIDPAWRRLARSLAHEIRNPLVSIRTFTELLPDHYADETFRARFKELVGKDVGHIQDVVTRLARAAERDRFVAVPTDVSALIDRLLDARRDVIVRRRLVVLSELERDRPLALADPTALETALGGLVDRALDSLPDRGDLFITSRPISRAGDGRPRLRVLLRHHNPQASGLSGELDPVHQILEYVLAETIVAALGGRLTIDPTLGPETLIVIDLPTP